MDRNVAFQLNPHRSDLIPRPRVQLPDDPPREAHPAALVPIESASRLPSSSPSSLNPRPRRPRSSQPPWCLLCSRRHCAPPNHPDVAPPPPLCLLCSRLMLSGRRSETSEMEGNGERGRRRLCTKRQMGVHLRAMSTSRMTSTPRRMVATTTSSSPTAARRSRPGGSQRRVGWRGTGSAGGKGRARSAGQGCA
jgi:hypothetical protein